MIFMQTKKKHPFTVLLFILLFRFQTNLSSRVKSLNKEKQFQITIPKRLKMAFKIDLIRSTKIVASVRMKLRRSCMSCIWLNDTSDVIVYQSTLFYWLFYCDVHILVEASNTDIFHTWVVSKNHLVRSATDASTFFCF